MNDLKIYSYKAIYNQSFYELNKAWIEEFWELEKSDINDLLHPKESIIDRGGEIFFAVTQDLVIGTAAMIPFPDNKIELAKMTVHQNYRGKGVSKVLMNSCISYAKKNNNKEIFLISNSKLKEARKLYENFGFVEVPLDSKKYIRGDYKMNLII
tara:strand:- start:291 stop:752 length:462 start_codon:yes stop_codon:yes gene_type:complete